jgi:putative peptide zinc metalloprotease protein
MSHAATLVAFGGVSRRVGFMLFYLMPAFFCDVSDAWRLKPAERVKVALAGIAAQGVLGAIAGMLAFILPRDLATLAAVFSLLCFIYGLLNLIPFVKLDGYIALIGYLDKPNLRARCMQEFKDWTAHVFMRPTRRPARKSSPYRLIFGLLCIAFPLMILTGAVTAAGSYLAPLGRTATLVQLVLAGSLVAWLAMRGIGHWVALRKSGTTKAAVAAYSFVSCVVAAVVLFVVPFPNTIRGGLYTDNEGPKFVVLGGASGSTAGTVDLYTAGLAPGKKVGVATTSGPQEPCVVPLAATVAVKETELTLDAQCIPLGFDGAAPRLGTAAWTGQSQTIFTWFETSAQNLLAP